MSIKLSSLLTMTAITTFTVYFRRYIPEPSDVLQYLSIDDTSATFKPWSEIADEPFCSKGFGTLHHDMWSMNKSEDAVDVLYGARKVRMYGYNTWFDKTAYGSIVAERGCNIWDIDLEYDTKLARVSGSVLGIISEDCVDVELFDPWYNVAENINMDAFTIYTRTGGKIFQGTYEDIKGGTNVTEPITRIRVILDFDGNVADDGTQFGNLIYKFPDDRVFYAYKELETGWDYRLVASSQMEESFKIV